VAARATSLLIATQKGLFQLDAGARRERFEVRGPTFLGAEVNHVVQDPRDPSTLLMAAKTGHLGPTVFRSSDRGETWTEAARPPQFAKAPEGTEEAKKRSVERVFFLTPGHASEPAAWWAGTVPWGLFRSADGGATWDPVGGFNDHPRREAWLEDAGATPGGAITHSIIVDPRDARHLYLGLSTGGVFESTDGGADWHPLNRGQDADFFPPEARDRETGHDPHCVKLCPSRPDRLYQQNHCGIYRIDRPSDTWTRIGKAMPKEIGDIGFPVVVHPRDPDVAWVFPMDGTDVWPRTPPRGAPALYRTRDAGASWERQDRGFPTAHAYFTVFRQAMTADAGDPVGIYFGTTAGEVWASHDEGATFRLLCAHLPRILAVEVAAWAA
jgi:hypothetical protein